MAPSARSLGGKRKIGDRSCDRDRANPSLIFKGVWMQSGEGHVGRNASQHGRWWLLTERRGERVSYRCGNNNTTKTPKEKKIIIIMTTEVVENRKGTSAYYKDEV